jgi:hypothetical protein
MARRPSSRHKTSQNRPDSEVQEASARESSAAISAASIRPGLAACRSRLEWQRIVDDLAELSEIDVEQDGRRARLRTAPGPTIDPICRAIGLTLPPVFHEMPPAA